MVATARTRPQEALLEQSRTVLGWLQDLSPESFERPTVLPAWTVRQLAGHLVLIHTGLLRCLDQPTKQAALPFHEFVTRYRRDVEMIMTATLEASEGLTGPEVATRLESAIDDLATKLDAGIRLSQVITTPRGPTTTEDFLATRIVELVVHTDDLNRSVPEITPAVLQRGALGRCTRALATILARRHPGRSVEVRVPPYAAVQCVEGPRHTRGTPPNVVEVEPVAWIELATGRLVWSDALADGRIAASGDRADLSPYLPVLS